MPPGTKGTMVPNLTKSDQQKIASRTAKILGGPFGTISDYFGLIYPKMSKRVKTKIAARYQGYHGTKSDQI